MTDRKPTIAIDGYNLAMPRGTGVATYGYTLAQALHGMNYSVAGLFGLNVAGPPDLREVLFFDALQRAEPPKRRRVWKWLRRPVRTAELLAPVRLEEVPLTGVVERSTFADRLPAFDRLYSAGGLFEHAHERFGRLGLFTRLRLPDPPEIMHWTYPVPLRLEGALNVYTLHDLVPLRLPYTTLDVKKTYHKLIERCVRTADHIVTVSEASRQDIQDLFGVPPERISVTYQASNLPAHALEASPEEDARVIEGLFGLERESYFLYFGAVEPKKNVGRLLEAFFTTRSAARLIIVGARSWSSDQELALFGGKGLSEEAARRVVWLEYLPRRVLFRLIRGARAVLFPSIYEGFGLPVHEAMLMGTPVLTSNVSSLPEVTGDAAVLVDPYSVDAIAHGIERLDRDEALRRDLGARGLAYSRRFSAEAYRTRLEETYGKVQSARKRG